MAEFDGEVELLAIPYDAFGSKLAAAIPLGEGPDVFIDSHERLGDFIHRGLVGALPDHALDPGDFLGPAVDAVTLPDADGHPRRWAVPLSMKSLALYVNTKLVANVPETLEGFEALKPTLPAGVFPVVWEANGAYAHAAILAAYDVPLLTRDEQFGMHGPRAERSLALVQRLLDAGVLPEDADGALVTDCLLYTSPSPRD